MYLDRIKAPDGIFYLILAQKLLKNNKYILKINIYLLNNGQNKILIGRTGIIKNYSAF